jgi:VWFA-related protein
MRINKFLFVLFSVLIFSIGLQAETLNLKINQILSKDFPNMEIYASIIDKNGEPVLSLSPENFKSFIDGNEVKTKIDVSGFQYTQDGINYALIMSVNGMMEGEAFDYQKKAAMRLVDALKEKDKLSVFAYGEDVKSIFELEKKGPALQEKISKIEISGFNPCMYDAVVFAARKFDAVSGNRRKVLIIMSDGRELGSKYSQDQTYKILQDSNIPVYSMGFKVTSGQNLYKLADLSDKSGGYYVFSDISGLPKTIERVSRQVTLGYVLKFKVKKLEGDNNYHQLQIKVRNSDGEASFNKNFIATKVPIKLWVKIVIIVSVIVVLAVIIILFFILRRKNRKSIGITKRKCPECHRRMKDDWDECIFCKYIPPKKKKKKDEVV